MASKIIVDQIEKTGGSLTALTLPTSNASASEFLQNDGAGALSWASASAGFSDVDSTVATSVAYTVPADITKLLVFITGAGGGGAGGQAAAAEGGGGNSGTTVMARVTVVPLDTITIAIGAAGTAGGSAANGGAGGNSTFTHASGSGSFDTITAPGGAGGRPGSSGASLAPTAGTVGASNEGISILGGRGASAYYGQGYGAASFWGGGGNGDVGAIASSPGTAYGSGGGGGSSTVITAAVGAVGVCFIMEFK